MTDESKAKTEPWVAEHDMRYPYAYEPSQKLFRELGLRGYPSAVLVDPAGEVIWTGHPASLQNSTVEKHLRGASRTPVIVTALTRGWPDAADPVKRHVADRDWADALEEARAIAEKHPEVQSVVTDLESLIRDRVAAVKRLYEKGDYMGLLEQAKPLEKQLKGLPAADEVEELVESVEKDRDAKAVVRGQQTVEKLRDMAQDARRRRDVRRLMEQLAKLAEQHAGTYAAAQANKLRDELAAKLDRLDR